MKRNCLDCKQDTKEIGEIYMVNNSLWPKDDYNQRIKGMLCIGCLEERLGRKLTREDFFPCLLNEIAYGNKSARLIGRLLN